MDTTQADIERFTRDALYFEARQGELLRDYPEQWIAIFNEQVVATNLDFERLLDDVQAKGIPVEQVFIEQVTANEETWILPG
ncbi:MAG: DUF5678 domain-containing protein [Chloroflexota bacterium]